MVSVSSGEPSDVAEVAEPSRAEGPAALVRVGRDPYQWGGPRLTWSDRNQPGTPPVFVLDDAEEQGYVLGLAAARYVGSGGYSSFWFSPSFCVLEVALYAGVIRAEPGEVGVPLP